jgi:hypothetical protein
MKWGLVTNVWRDRANTPFNKNLKYFDEVIIEAAINILRKLMHHILFIGIELCYSLVTWIFLENSKQKLEFLLIHCILHGNCKVKSTNEHQICKALMSSPDSLLEL